MSGINLESCGILREDILNGVVDRLCESIEDELRREAKQRVLEKVGSRSQELVDGVILDRAREIMSSQFRPLTLWGEAKGPPTTINEIMEESIKSFWTQKVDQNGKPVHAGYGNNMSRAQYLAREAIQDAVKEAVRSDFQKLVADAQTQLKNEVSTALARVIKERLPR